MKRLFLLLFGMVYFSVGSAVMGADQPNILFIFTDDHAYQSIGAYGSKINKTPNIDRIANEGMLFNRCYVTNSICGPMRAVIQTGKYSHLNGFVRNGNRFNGGQQTFPKLLRKAGYETAVVGKWHLASEPQGFDYHEVLIGQGPYYNPTMLKFGERVKHTGYTTHIITDLAMDWLKNKRDKDKPFMLMYQHKAPHRNWEPGPKYLTMYDDVEIPEPATLFDNYEGREKPAHIQDMTISKTMNDRDLKLSPPRGFTEEQLKVWNAAYGPKNEAFRKANLKGKELVRWKYQRYIKDYLRCIAAVDDDIGKVLKYLDESGLSKNTIVIYCSDQGFYLGEHGWFDKRWMYEESLRTPFVVRWPGKIKPGSVNNDIVSPLDFAQTFLDIAGVEQPDDMQGRSLVPIFEGNTPDDWRKYFYYHYYEYPGPHSVRKHYGVTNGRFKLIRYYEPQIDTWELFDLQQDPNEMRSVYRDPAYQEVVKEMTKELRRLQVKYKEPDPEQPIENSNQRQLRNGLSKYDKVEAVFSLADAKAKHPDKPDVAMKPFIVGAKITPESGDGVVLAQGGGAYGYSLYLKGGKPMFAVRTGSQLALVGAEEALKMGEGVHVAGQLNAKGQLVVLVNGKAVARKRGLVIEKVPAEGLSIGQDTGDAVSEYAPPMPFKGKLSDIRLITGVPKGDVMKQWVGD